MNDWEYNSRFIGAIIVSALAVSIITSSLNVSNTSTTGQVITNEKRPLVLSLTFDVEDISDLNETISVPAILDILERYSATGTFFILGEVSRLHPEMVEDIHRKGHEIGMHADRHELAIFNMQGAEKIAEVYKTSSDYVWSRSFQEYENFKESIENNREALVEVVGEVEITSFRAPCLVPNWVKDEEYFSVLKDSGVTHDSSYKHDLSSMYTEIIPYETKKGIIEIPVTKSFDMIEMNSDLVINRMIDNNAPLVLFFHPKELSEKDIEKLEEFLRVTEQNFNVKYLPIKDIPEKL